MTGAGARRLVLASRSPQRRAILEQLGIPFTVRATDVVEVDAGPPDAVASENALRKALAVAGDEDGVVLGVDTVVATGADLWGKPPDAQAARETLRRLSGRTHRVVGGVAVVAGETVRHAFTATTQVTFRALDDRLLDWYVAAGEWEDRAGGYAIQGRGAALVTAIAGDYLNVVGLPVAALLDAWPELLALGA
ncbi:MAG TPA: Maf family protein [Solirubrobacteraceae bacterium]|nr:Maf family protein [Solirubrobacteraceae bacterium]